MYQRSEFRRTSTGKRKQRATLKGLGHAFLTTHSADRQSANDDEPHRGQMRPRRSAAPIRKGTAIRLQQDLLNLSPVVLKRAAQRSIAHANRHIRDSQRLSSAESVQDLIGRVRQEREGGMAAVVADSPALVQKQMIREEVDGTLFNMLSQNSEASYHGFNIRPKRKEEEVGGDDDTEASSLAASDSSTSLIFGESSILKRRERRSPPAAPAQGQQLHAPRSVSFDGCDDGSVEDDEGSCSIQYSVAEQASLMSAITVDSLSDYARKISGRSDWEQRRRAKRRYRTRQPVPVALGHQRVGSPIFGLSAGSVVSSSLDSMTIATTDGLDTEFGAPVPTRELVKAYGSMRATTLKSRITSLEARMLLESFDDDGDEFRGSVSAGGSSSLASFHSLPGSDSAATAATKDNGEQPPQEEEGDEEEEGTTNRKKAPMKKKRSRRATQFSKGNRRLGRARSARSRGRKDTTLLKQQAMWAIHDLMEGDDGLDDEDEEEADDHQNAPFGKIPLHGADKYDPHDPLGAVRSRPVAGIVRTGLSLQEWRRERGEEAQRFRSVALQTEARMQQAMASTSWLGAPNVFRVATAFDCLSRLLGAFGAHGVDALAATLLREILVSVYSKFDELFPNETWVQLLEEGVKEDQPLDSLLKATSRRRGAADGEHDANGTRPSTAPGDSCTGDTVVPDSRFGWVARLLTLGEPYFLTNKRLQEETVETRKMLSEAQHQYGDIQLTISRQRAVLRIAIKYWQKYFLRLVVASWRWRCRMMRKIVDTFPYVRLRIWFWALYRRCRNQRWEREHSAGGSSRKLSQECQEHLIQISNLTAALKESRDFEVLYHQQLLKANAAEKTRKNWQMMAHAAILDTKALKKQQAMMNGGGEVVFVTTTAAADDANGGGGEGLRSSQLSPPPPPEMPPPSSATEDDSSGGGKPSSRKPHAHAHHTGFLEALWKLHNSSTDDDEHHHRRFAELKRLEDKLKAVLEDRDAVRQEMMLLFAQVTALKAKLDQLGGEHQLLVETTAVNQATSKELMQALRDLQEENNTALPPRVIERINIIMKEYHELEDQLVLLKNKLAAQAERIAEALARSRKPMTRDEDSQTILTGPVTGRELAGDEIEHLSSSHTGLGGLGMSPNESHKKKKKKKKCIKKSRMAMQPLIAEIYSKKMNVDSIDDRDEHERMRLDQFVKDFFRRKYGDKRLSEEHTRGCEYAATTYGVDRDKHNFSRRIHMFGQLCGWVDDECETSDHMDSHAVDVYLAIFGGCYKSPVEARERTNEGDGFSFVSLEDFIRSLNNVLPSAAAFASPEEEAAAKKPTPPQPNNGVAESAAALDDTVVPSSPIVHSKSKRRQRKVSVMLMNIEEKNSKQGFADKLQQHNQNHASSAPPMFGGHGGGIDVSHLSKFHLWMDLRRRAELLDDLHGIAMNADEAPGKRGGRQTALCSISEKMRVVDVDHAMDLAMTAWRDQHDESVQMLTNLISTKMEASDKHHDGLSFEDFERMEEELFPDVFTTTRMLKRIFMEALEAVHPELATKRHEREQHMKRKNRRRTGAGGRRTVESDSDSDSDAGSNAGCAFHISRSDIGALALTMIKCGTVSPRLLLTPERKAMVAFLNDLSKDMPQGMQESMQARVRGFLARVRMKKERAAADRIEALLRGAIVRRSTKKRLWARGGGLNPDAPSGLTSTPKLIRRATSARIVTDDDADDGP